MVLETLLAGVKWMECKADHSLLFGAVVKSKSNYTSISHKPSRHEQWPYLYLLVTSDIPSELPFFISIFCLQLVNWSRDSAVSIVTKLQVDTWSIVAWPLAKIRDFSLPQSTYTGSGEHTQPLNQCVPGEKAARVWSLTLATI
jgi:hypothetical protein